MANDLRYVNSGDKILASQYNKIVDYVNGPGEYSTGEYITTQKGVLYQNGDEYINGEGDKPIPLLQGSIRCVYNSDTSSYNDCYHLQLGATEIQTYESFTLDNRPIQSIYVCNVESDEFGFKVSSDTWDQVNQGLLNTKIKTTLPEEISSFYDGLRGVFYTLDTLSSDNHGNDDVDIASIYTLLVITNHPEYSLSIKQEDNPLDNAVFNLLENDEQLSSLDFELSSLTQKYSFPIISYTQILSTDYYQQNLIQHHLGGYRYYTPFPKFPWEVNVNTGRIERAYVQIGTHMFDSEISSTDISGDNYLMVDIDNLSCELGDSPKHDATIVPFKMFNFQRGLQVEYYNFMPVVPCWEKYEV